MPIKTSAKLTMVEIPTDTRQKLKMVASLEAMTIPEYLKFLVGRAYEAAIINRSRKISLSKGK